MRLGSPSPYGSVRGRPTARMRSSRPVARSSLSTGSSRPTSRDRTTRVRSSATARGGWAAAAEAERAARGRRVPELAEGDALTVVELGAEGHETRPPARYTEASLVKGLEDRAVGRRSDSAPDTL